MILFLSFPCVKKGKTYLSSLLVVPGEFRLRAKLLLCKVVVSIPKYY